jgi:hypothetical protein
MGEEINSLAGKSAESSKQLRALVACPCDESRARNRSAAIGKIETLQAPGRKIGANHRLGHVAPGLRLDVVSQ